MKPEEISKAKINNKSKDLLRLENAIYGLIDQPVDPKEKALKKMMQKKQKPKFQLPKQSSLLKQVKNFLPMIQRQNAKLLNQQMSIQKLDAHFEKEESSSESSENEQSQKPRSQKMQQQIYPQKHIEMNLLLVPQLSEQSTINPPKIIEQEE